MTARRKRAAPSKATDGTVQELSRSSQQRYPVEVPESLRDAALLYARLGCLVLPLYTGVNGLCDCWLGHACGSPGKHPRLQHGSRGATNDRRLIRSWWRTWPRANVGIATGTPSGLFVLDIDPPHGGNESLSIIESEQGRLPLTYTVETGSGGQHRYFSMVGTDPPIRNSAGKLGPGLDVRGQGGYVVAPPSVTPSGHYLIINNLPVNKPPLWLIKRLQRSPVKRQQPRQGQSRPLAPQPSQVSLPPLRKLDDAVGVMLAAQVGSRNETLFRVAAWAGEHLVAGQTPGDVIVRLTKAAEIAGLPSEEIDRTLWSGLDSGRGTR